ncbi:hypothetical protein BDF19DRAFT_18972 [Syncephalis fuscata]|nr:hypothetical protein BDF19DRAFT_18972 [Syncephalis fuscata]
MPSAQLAALLLITLAYIFVHSIVTTTVCFFFILHLISLFYLVFLLTSMSTSMTSTLRRERTNTVSSQASAPHPLAPPPTPTFSSKPFDWGNTIIIYDGSSSEYLHLLSDDLSELPKSITTSNKPSVAPMMFESDHIASYHQQPAIAMHPSPLSPVVQQQQSTKGAVKQTSSEYQTKGEQPSVLCTSPVLEFRKSSEEDTTADSTDISEEDNTFDSEDDNESTNNTKSAKIRNRCIRRERCGP